MDVIESAAESSLSGDDTMAVTKVAYRSHLIIANLFFIFFDNNLRDLDSFSGVSLLSTPRIGVFFSLKGVARPCRALRIRVGQMRELALADGVH